MRRSVLPFVALTLTLSLATIPAPTSAQTPSQAQSKPDPNPEQKPDPKSEPKAEPAFAGKWNMSIETPGGQRPAGLEVKLDGKKITGSMTSEIGATPITGELAEGNLVFSITIDMNGQSVAISFTGTTQKDGSLAGTASLAGQGMTWTATRVKEK